MEFGFSDFGFGILESRFFDFGVWILESGFLNFWCFDFGIWILESGFLNFWCFDFGIWILESGLGGQYIVLLLLLERQPCRKVGKTCRKVSVSQQQQQQQQQRFAISCLWLEIKRCESRLQCSMSPPPKLKKTHDNFWCFGT